MKVSLNPIRVYTEDDVYHYTSDNRPILDLKANDEILATAIDNITSNSYAVVQSGSWASLSIALNLNQDLGKPFAYKINLFAIQDQSVLAAQDSNFSEDIIIGYNDLGTGVTVLNTTNIFNKKIGTATLVKTFSGNGVNLNINFSGYTGLKGYVLARVERFGVDV